MCVRFSMPWKLPLPPCLRCLCRTQWTPVLQPCDPLGTVPAPELSTREESSESVTHPQNLFLPPETIFSVKTWRTRRIQTHEGTEFEWEGEDRAEIELQQDKPRSDSRAQLSQLCGCSNTYSSAPRMARHMNAMKMRAFSWFPVEQRKHTLCRNTLPIKNKKKNNLCFTVVLKR